MDFTLLVVIYAALRARNCYGGCKPTQQGHPGANVVVKGTNNGVQTGLDGNTPSRQKQGRTCLTFRYDRY
jgi:hypothetical protein